MKIALAILLAILIGLAVLAISATVLLYRLASAPWRRIAKRRAEDRRRVLEAIVRHEYGRRA